MSLLENGYWNSQYFAENYWAIDYWQEHTSVIPAFLLLSLTQGFPLQIALTQEVL